MLTSDTQGESLAFTAALPTFSVAGEFLEIDTGAKTIYLNGDPDGLEVLEADVPDLAVVHALAGRQLDQVPSGDVHRSRDTR